MRDLIHPESKVASQGSDLVGPYAFNSGRQLVVLVLGHVLDRPIEHRQRVQQPSLRDRQRAVCLHSPIELGLHRVEETALREWVHSLKRLEIVRWPHSIDGTEEELIRTRRIPLKGRQ